MKILNKTTGNNCMKYLSILTGRLYRKGFINRFRCNTCLLLSIILLIGLFPSTVLGDVRYYNYTEGTKRKYTVTIPVSEFIFNYPGTNPPTQWTNDIAISNNNTFLKLYSDSDGYWEFDSAWMVFRTYTFVTDNKVSIESNIFPDSYNPYYSLKFTVGGNPSAAAEANVLFRQGDSINPNLGRFRYSTSNSVGGLFGGFGVESSTYPYTETKVYLDPTTTNINDWYLNVFRKHVGWSAKYYDESESGQSKSITVSPDTIECEVGDTVTFNAAISPSTLAATWSSTAPTIGQISSSSAGNGVGQCKITAKAVGQTSVYLKSDDGSVSGVGTLIVKPKSIQPTSISLNQSALNLKPNQTSQLTATVQPTTATDKTVGWSSDNSSIASVSQTGLVTAISNGTTFINAETSNGKIATCKVTVTTPVTGVNISTTSLSLPTNASYKLEGSVLPATASNQNLTWTSSNTGVVSVDQTGMLLTHAKGTATITVKSSENASFAKTCTVTVAEPDNITKVINLHNHSLDMNVGETKTITAYVSPTSLQTKWTSSDSTVASVDTVGNVTAKKNGTAKITLASTDGKVSDSCTVTVSTTGTNVSLNKTDITLDINKSDTLVATITPSTASDKTVIWNSDNSSIASVSQSGVVTGVSNGTTFITATSADGKKATCKVTVKTPVTGIDISTTSVSIPVNSSFKLNANVLPSTATNQGVTWSSDKSDIVSVDSTGMLLASKVGTAVVTAKSAENNSFAKTCNVTVYEVNDVSKVINLHTHEMTLNVGDTRTLTAYISPSNLQTKWSSSAPDIVSVDTMGNITAKKNGTAVITLASADNTVKDSCTVTVSTATENITLDKTNVNLTVGDTDKLTATITPSTSSNTNIIWESSDETVVSVSQSGDIEALRNGMVVITAKSADNENVKATCTVTVGTNLSGITMNPKTLNLNINQGYSLTYDIQPSTTTDKSVKWLSSDESIAIVNNNGYVLAVGSGKATITVEHIATGMKDTCGVTITQPVSGLYLNKSKLRLNVNESEQLIAKVIPDNATNKIVTWSSDDEDVATVSNTGLVTVVSGGIATITAEVGGIVATCEVTGSVLPESISISDTELVLPLGDTHIFTATINPSTTTNKGFTWSSSNPNVAYIDTNGKLEALKSGTATITVVSNADNNITATCTVTVKAPVTDIGISTEEVDLAVGDSYTLYAYPNADAFDKTLRWSVNSSSIISLNAISDNEAKVTANKTGTGIVTVQSADGNFKKTCTVNVSIPVQYVLLDKSELTLSENTGETYQLYAEIKPWNATQNGIVFISDDSRIARVDRNTGLIKAISKGITTIRAYSTDQEHYAECKVEVIRSVEDLKLDINEKEILVDATLKLNHIFTPLEPTDSTVRYYSSDTNVATVDNNGVVTGVSRGVAEISCVSNDNTNLMDTCKVTVVQDVKGVELSEHTLDMDVGNTKTLTATIKPSNANNQNITWNSDNPDIVSVVNGELKALSKGTATITVTTEDGNKTDSCVITVTDRVSKVELSESKIKLKPNETHTLTATVSPSTASNPNVEWFSEDASIATVSNGEVTGIKYGTTRIGVRTLDGNMEAYCDVEVKVDVTGIELEEYNSTIKPMETTQIVPVIIPADASIKDVTYKSSDTKVATVSQSGMITAVSPGTASIEVISVDGNFKAEYIITVRPLAQVYFIDDNMSVKKGTTSIINLNTESAMDGDVLNFSIESTSSSQPTNIIKLDKTSVVVDKNSIKDNLLPISVTGLSDGTTTIRVTTSDNLTDTIDITVSTPVEQITLPEDNITMSLGSTYTVKPVILPDDATNKTLVYEVKETGTETDTNIITLTPSDDTSTATVKATSIGAAQVVISDNTKSVSTILNILVNNLNIDTDSDGKPDINIDLDNDGKPDINIDINGDLVPDINIDINGDNIPDINIDTDNDNIPDINIDIDGDSVPDVNIDLDDDGFPDINIDVDNDVIPDINIDLNGDNIPDINVDTNDDGIPDINIDTNNDGVPDINIDVNGDSIPDINIDTDHDGIPDINIDINNDNIPDINIDLDGDGKPDINIDIDGNNNPDVNIDIDGDNVPDINIDTNGDMTPDINIDINGDNIPDINIDTDNDNIPDINIDTNNDGKPDINIDTDNDKIPDVNVDTNGDNIPDINIDTNNDNIPDINIDTNGDGKPDINIDINNNGKPDINIDTTGDGKADTNIDTDGDGVPDINIDGGTDKPKVNVDTNGDGVPDINIDVNGDGIPDINIDVDGDNLPDINIDINGDGKPDINIDTNHDGKPDVNIDIDDDNIPDINIDLNDDNIPDINIDSNQDGKPDINIDVNGDNIPDLNVDTDNDGKPDLNVDTDNDGKPDLNVDTDGDNIPDVNIDTTGDGKPDKNIDADGDGIVDNPDNSNNGGGSSGGGGGGGGGFKPKPVEPEVKPDIPNKEEIPDNPQESEEDESNINIIGEEPNPDDIYKDVQIVNDDIQRLQGDERGLREDDTVTRAEFAVMLSRVFELNGYPKPSFKDVNENAWYYPALEKLNIWTGYDDKTFKPNNTITRAELATVLNRLPHIQTYDKQHPQYLDVADDTWYYNHVISASQKGILTGYDDGTFKPKKDVTRREAIFAINKLLGHDVEF